MAHPAPPPPSARTAADDPDAWEVPLEADPRPPDDGDPGDWRDRVGELRGRLGLDVRLVAWAAVAVVAAGAAAWLLRPAPAPFEETLPRASTEVVGAGGAPSTDAAGAPAAAPGAATPGGGDASTTSVPTEVVAYAAGAVAHPGVYRLDPTARVDDLVRAAGGLGADADAARINLAAPLVDGARVYVPHLGEEAPPEVAGPDVAAPPGGGVDTGGGTGAGDAPAALIDINTASEDELDELPGVGPSIAGSIVTYRTENGGFATVDELLEVRGIGEAKMAEIAPLVTV